MPRRSAALQLLPSALLGVAAIKSSNSFIAGKIVNFGVTLPSFLPSLLPSFPPSFLPSFFQYFQFLRVSRLREAVELWWPHCVLGCIRWPPQVMTDFPPPVSRSREVLNPNLEGWFG